MYKRIYLFLKDSVAKPHSLSLWVSYQSDVAISCSKHEALKIQLVIYQ